MHELAPTRMAKRAAPEDAVPPYQCPVCSHRFGTQNALECHLRDKQDGAHHKHRSSAPDPASCETAVKRPRTRNSVGAGGTGGTGSEVATGGDDSCSGTGDAAESVGIARKLGGIAQGALTKLSDIAHGAFATARAPSMSSDNDIAAGPQQQQPAPPAAPARSLRPRLEDKPRDVENDAQVRRQVRRQEQSEHEALLQEHHALKEKYDKLTAQCRQLAKDRAKMREETSALRETMNEWRAARAAAAAGNDNINSNFPFRKDILQSYAKLTGESGILWELLDPCVEAEDIPLTRDVSKAIFTDCCITARRLVVEPKDKFKELVLAGEGGQEVQEWEDARVHMTKVQRATRERLVKQVEAGVDQEVNKWLGDQHHPVFRLAKMEGFQKQRLSKCIYQLFQVPNS